jgi:hypothetical protein
VATARQERDHKRHEQAIVKIAARALLAGETIAVEECPNEMYGRLIGSTKRWVLTVGHLQPGEVLMLDPRQFPKGAQLAIIHPGQWRPPLVGWLTYRDVSLFLGVSVKRLYNAVAQHKLERRVVWKGRGRDRRRLTWLPPATCHRLAELTGNAFMIDPDAARPAQGGDR